MHTQSLGTSQRRLSIAILGVGGIGSAFAFQLSRTGGHDVTVVARPGSPRLQQLQRDGGIVNVQGARAEVRVAAVLDEASFYDLVIVTLPAYQAEAVLPALQRCSAKWVQFMFNTFEPERLSEAVGPDRCSFGMPFIQASLDQQGRLNAKIGAAGQKTKMNAEDWVDLFNSARIPSVFEPDMFLWLRCHVPLCIAFESVSVAGMRQNGGATWAESTTIARGMQESFKLIERLGYVLYPNGKRQLRAAPEWVAAGTLWAMSRIPTFRKLLATGRNECLALVDVLLAHGQDIDPPVSLSAIEAMKPL